MSRRVSLHDRDAAGISDTAAAKTSSVVDTLIAPAGQTVDLINVDQLFAHPDNPRGQVGDVDELADSIKANGLLEPLIVCHAEAWQALDDRLPYLTAIDYVIIAGHRRKTAATQAGLRDVPCIVRDDLVGANAEVAMLVENLQREDLTPLQEAQGFRRLEQQGKSQRDIARLVGRNQSHVSKRLALLKLPERLQARVGTAGKDSIDINDAVTLAKIADAPPSVLESILKRPSWKSIDDAVDEAVAQRKRDAELAKKREQLTASGITNIIRYPQYGFYRGDKPPTPLEYLADDGVDITEHEHCVCHAVAVGYSYNNTDLRTVPVCTDPTKHGVASKAARAADAAAKEQKRREREKAKAAKRRLERAQIIAGLGNQYNGADVAAAVNAAQLDMLLEQTWGEQSSELATLLQLTVDDDTDADDVIRAHAATGPRASAQVITTATLYLALDYQGAGKVAVLQLLERHGYKLDTDEKLQVKRVTEGSTAHPAQLPVADEYDGVTCPDCDHAEPQEGCDCEHCFCNPANVDEPVASEAVPA